MLLLLSCAFTSHVSSTTEEQHRQLSEAASSHLQLGLWAADDNVKHSLTFATLTLVAKRNFLWQDAQ